MTPRAEMTAVLGAIAVSAGLVLLAASRPRATVEGQGAALSGELHTPAAAALALVALAGVGALLLVRGWARTVIAILLVLVGAGVVVTMGTIPEYGWFTYSGDPPAATRSAWAWVGMGAGVLLGIAAALAAVRARRWPQPRRRYDSPAPGRPPSDANPWDALDRGEDPTR